MTLKPGQVPSMGCDVRRGRAPCVASETDHQQEVSLGWQARDLCGIDLYFFLFNWCILLFELE